MRVLPILALLIAPLPAAAQDQPGTRAIVAVPPGPAGKPAMPPIRGAEPAALFIAGCDADGDAHVTRAELSACIERSFERFDPRRTGAMGYIAFSDWSERYLGDRNTVPSPFEVDRDGDNRITLAELKDRFEAYFVRFDADKDGTVTRAELLTIQPQMPGMPGRGRDGRRGH